MRTCGYAFEKQTGDEQAFVRRISGYDYPRFHAYIRYQTSDISYQKNEQVRSPKPEIRNLIINLHIDQKKPTYGSHTAHSGEYDGELVSAEIERIKHQALLPPTSPKNSFL